MWNSGLELIMPDFNKPFVLEADASDIGLGAALRQDGKPIAYLSRLLSKAERNYTITEREVLAALWAMEKMEFFLIGKTFTLVTDHRAIESIRLKKDFGTPRIQRWLERLERFNFDIMYREGEKMIVSDTLSREIKDENLIVDFGSDNERKVVLETHYENSHRKGIRDKLKKKNIQLTTLQIQNILKECEICEKFDKKYVKEPSKFIKTSNIGERVAVDILELSKGRKFLIGVDYFSRYALGVRIRKKSSAEVIKFLNLMNREIKIKELVSDMGREFRNGEVAKWCKQNKTSQYFAIPYYHSTNGRVERLNRTLREALKRDGSTDIGTVLKKYNEQVHRGIGMTPTEAKDAANYEKVLVNQEKYSKEFRLDEIKERFEIGDKVLLRKEVKTSKNDEEFLEHGTVSKILGDQSYEISLDESNKTTVRHRAQLRIKQGNVGHDYVQL